MTDEQLTPETLREVRAVTSPARPSPDMVRMLADFLPTMKQAEYARACADAWAADKKILEANPDDPYPTDGLGLSEEAEQWVQAIWRMARIHQSARIQLERRLEAVERDADDEVDYQGRLAAGEVEDAIAREEKPHA